MSNKNRTTFVSTCITKWKAPNIINIMLIMIIVDLFNIMFKKFGYYI